MQSFRHSVANRPGLAALVLALALMMRLFLPAGTMLSAQSTVLTVTICTDATQGPQVRQMVIPMAPKGGHSGGQTGGHAKDGGTCSFGALSMAAIGADPILLALALAFIVALGLHVPAAARVLAAERLRPPLRGPPLPA